MFTAAVVWFKPACNCQTALRYLLGYLRCNFFCVLCEILQVATRFFAFSKKFFRVVIQKKRLFCVLRFDRYTYKQFALGYLLRCALFAFREFCKKQHAFSHSQKIVFVSQFKKNVCFVFCCLTGTRAKQFALGYLLRCVP